MTYNNTKTKGRSTRAELQTRLNDISTHLRSYKIKGMIDGLEPGNKTGCDEKDIETIKAHAKDMARDLSKLSNRTPQKILRKSYTSTSGRDL